MVVRNDDGRRVALQCLLHDFTRIHQCLVDRAAEYFGVFDQAIVRIEKQHREHLVLKPGQLGALVFLDHRRLSERRAALHLLVDGLTSRIQNLVGSGQQIAAPLIAHHQRGIEGGKGKL